MSNNCFVTKLKGIVNDDTLSKFGELPIKMSAGSFMINNSTSDTLIRSDKDSLSLSNGGTGSKTVTVPKASDSTSLITVYVTQDCTVFIPQYYLNRLQFTPADNINITSVGLGLTDGAYISILSSSVAFHLGELPKNARSIASSMCTFGLALDEYPYLIMINCNLINYAFVVDSKELAEKLPALRDYTLWTSADKSIGTFDEWGICKSLNSLTGYHGSGTIEGFVANQRAVYGSRPARTSGSVTLRYLGAVTFNGSTISSGTAKVLSWTANTITFDGTTINA